MTSVIAIVGAGHAGVQLADSLRDEGYAGEIVLVGAERELPYQRPPLTKDFLRGGATHAELLPLRAGEFYGERGIGLRLGRRAQRIDRERRRLVLEDGESVAYDQLVLATGARSRPFPAAAGDARVHTIRDAEDATRFGGALDRADSLAIVGAGFIGLEVAAAARGRDIDVTVVTSGPPLSRLATPALSAFLLDAHAARGVRFVVDDVTAIDTSRERGGSVATRSGEAITADVVLVAIGALANLELARDAGLVTSSGVDVDAYGRTSDERIWAIGDVATRTGLSGEPLRDESVQAATHQARCLARTLMGRPTQCTEVPWFWSNQGDIRLQIAGTPHRSAESVVRGEPGRGRFSVFSFVAGRLVAVESVNAPADHLAARRILAADADLTPGQAGDPAFDLKSFSFDVARCAQAAGARRGPEATAAQAGHLEWTILSSFTAYVRGMADGVVRTEQGARESAEGAFVFPLRTVRTGPESMSYVFAGTVGFRGHGGMLDLPIGDIEVRVRDGVCQIEIADPDEPDVRLLFASGRAQVDGTAMSISASLTEEGSELFFYRYRTGYELEPLRIAAHLVPEAQSGQYVASGSRHAGGGSNGLAREHSVMERKTWTTRESL
jgi:3-phenylpropionate/trans-cinnamate dioxygenase ferredoxin reductase component